MRQFIKIYTLGHSPVDNDDDDGYVILTPQLNNNRSECGDYVFVGDSANPRIFHT